MADYLGLYWRVGHRIGRTIYAIVNQVPNNDSLIGVMDTPELAMAACVEHNQALARRRKQAMPPHVEVITGSTPKTLVEVLREIMARREFLVNRGWKHNPANGTYSHNDRHVYQVQATSAVEMQKHWDKAGIEILDTVGCSRCHGDGHSGLEFAKLRFPIEHEGKLVATHFATCPVTSEPIVMRFFTPDDEAAQVEVKPGTEEAVANPHQTTVHVEEDYSQACGARYREDGPWTCNKHKGHSGEHAAVSAPAGEHITWDEPEPTPEQLESPEFEAIWQVIKHWDISTEVKLDGRRLYSGGTGSHVTMILDALGHATGHPADKQPEPGSLGGANRPLTPVPGPEQSHGPIPEYEPEQHVINWYTMAWHLADALRRTQEYVGNCTLPPLAGWSWYDALAEWKRALELATSDDTGLTAHALREQSYLLRDRLILNKLVETAKRHDRVDLSLIFKQGDGKRWRVMSVFGQEAPDSPIAAGSGYTAREALREALGIEP